MAEAQRYWLIETARNEWWDGRKVGETASFTSNPNQACRFSRFEDAEVVRCWLLEQGQQRLRSTEHISVIRALSPTPHQEKTE